MERYLPSTADAVILDIGLPLLNGRDVRRELTTAGRHEEYSKSLSQGDDVDWLDEGERRIGRDKRRSGERSRIG